MSIPPQNKTSKDVYIFITHSMAIGGIESLIVRMINGLVGIGAEVHIFCPPGPMRKSLHLSAHQHEYLNNKDLGKVLRAVDFSQHSGAKIWLSLPNLIIRLFWLSRHLEKNFNIKSKMVSGIFHPNQIRKTPFLSIQYLKTLALHRLLPSGSVYFMNNACKVAHRKRWGNMFESWPVHQIFMANESSEPSWLPSQESALKIVSVGRIVRFKGYNYAACQVVHELNKKGINVSWDIYGAGEDLQLLSDESRKAGLDNVVRFLGSIPYDKFSSTVTQYDVFIGMGTAALEAAQLGIPTILSIESTLDLSYGFISAAPSDSIGEEVPGEPKVKLVDAVISFTAMGYDDQIECGKQCQLQVIRRAGGEEAPYSSMFSEALTYPADNSFSKSNFLRLLVWLRILNNG